MSTIRIETDAASDLASVHMWLAQHRGKIVSLDENTRVMLGVPISGARAVIVAAVVHDDAHPGPQLGGVLRAVSSRTDGEPARLVFEGRSPGGLSREQAETAATELLEHVNRQIAGDGLVAKVA
jgi:hypothetical protein